jgi:hypothetical protein
MDFERAVKFARYNSGRHFLDSGDAYGRHHEQPAPSPGPVAEGGRIITARLLAEHFDENETLDAEFQAFAAERDGSWFENEDEFLTSLGYVVAARDNTYNQDNDLSQDFVWCVWRHGNVEDRGDWVWDATKGQTVVSDEGRELPAYVTTVFAHTGCDIRGGYSPPIFGAFDGETALPDLVVGWYLAAEDEADEDAEAVAAEWNDRGEFSVGYSSSPRYHLESKAESCEEREDGALVVVFEGKRLVATCDFCYS